MRKYVESCLKGRSRGFEVAFYQSSTSSSQSVCLGVTEIKLCSACLELEPFLKLFRVFSSIFIVKTLLKKYVVEFCSLGNLLFYLRKKRYRRALLFWLGGGK